LETIYSKKVSKVENVFIFAPHLGKKLMSEQDNKVKILHEAETLFMKYGFKSITMDDVARELGVSKKTLYQYFTDKNDLVDQCVENYLEMMQTTCTKISFDKSVDAVSMMLSITEFVGKMLRQVNPSSMYDLKKYFKPAWDNFEHGLKKGLYRKDIDSEMVTRLYIYLISFLTDPDTYDKTNTDIRKLHIEIVKYHLRSICTVKGNELLEEKLKQLKLK
jgi:AcrR family transcriptional regulator